MKSSDQPDKRSTSQSASNRPSKLVDQDGNSPIEDHRPELISQLKLIEVANNKPTDQIVQFNGKDDDKKSSNSGNDSPSDSSDDETESQRQVANANAAPAASTSSSGNTTAPATTNQQQQRSAAAAASYVAQLPPLTPIDIANWLTENATSVMGSPPTSDDYSDSGNLFTVIWRNPVNLSGHPTPYGIGLNLHIDSQPHRLGSAWFEGYPNLSLNPRNNPMLRTLLRVLEFWLREKKKKDKTTIAPAPINKRNGPGPGGGPQGGGKPGGSGPGSGTGAIAVNS